MWAKIFLYIFGLLWVMGSAIMIFAPKFCKKLCRSCLKVPPWLLGIISVGFAFLLWVSNQVSLSPCLVKATALLALWKGLFLLLVPKADLEKTIEWSLGLSDMTYRIWGILLLPVAIYFLFRIV